MRAVLVTEKFDTGLLNTQITDALAPAGFDIVQPFNIAHYNDFARENPRLPPFPDFARKDALALLIGNTKSAWAPFLADYHARFAQGMASANPFDGYAERTVAAALKDIPMDYEVRFGHHQGSQFVSLLHACEASHFAKISPANLAIHPEHGLWFGLRAVAVFDCAPLNTVSNNWTSPCEACAAPCKDVSQALMARHNNDWRACSWQERVTVRNACPVGQDARYSDRQIRYHYSRDIAALA